MKHPMIKLALSLLSLAIVQSTYAATPLKDYRQLSEALKKGSSVDVKVDLTTCTPQSGTKPAQSSGGLRINSYRVTPNGAIAFSDDHFTVSELGTPIRQLIRYTITEDSSVRVNVFMYNLPSYTPYKPVYVYNCALNRGVSLIEHP